MPKPPAADVDVELAFLLFADTAVEGLLRVQDAPMSFRRVAKPKDGMWNMDEGCARVVLEAWRDEVSMDGRMGKKVVWVEMGSSRTARSCNAQRVHAYGSKRVVRPSTCRAASVVMYRVLGVVKKGVVLVE
ncbi:hypothetical protein K439DRAFT_1625244 [Ramaria rubella]|nr:hypothetical protein K439DRAFT_1625244 [Ramaria rubella]